MTLGFMKTSAHAELPHELMQDQNMLRTKLRPKVRAASQAIQKTL